jgi:acetylornithine deacetylase/succinyl-diaminopimelate desuccinylase-like protein
MNPRRLTTTLLCSAVALSALSGCKTKGEIVVDQSVGITAVRSKCPAVGIPDYTGDMTLFRTPGDRTAPNIDVVAAMTDVRAVCNEADTAGEKVTSQVSFQVLARRNDTAGARTVTLPFFVSVLQGGSAVLSKRVGTVTINFADGKDRAQATATVNAFVDRAAATLPEDIRDRITRKRKAGDTDAASDPLADPQVKAAVARASFEVLVGFQLDETQLAYNATR